jgi:hypothetical protein
MQEQVERIANRHVARCLSKIEEVFTLPDIVANTVRQEMHFCAKDVAEACAKQGVRSNGNRD